MTDGQGYFSGSPGCILGSIFKLISMRAFILSVVLFAVCIGCAKQPSLPSDSKFNVTAVLNDTAWFGTGKVLRLIEQGQKIEKAKKFTLVVFTDIDYPGMGNGPNPNTDNGCVDPECTRTQGLLIYNVPLKKGTYKINKLDKKSELPNERANFANIGNSGGMLNRYIYTGSTPGRILVANLEDHFEACAKFYKEAQVQTVLHFRCFSSSSILLYMHLCLILILFISIMLFMLLLVLICSFSSR